MNAAQVIVGTLVFIGYLLGWFYSEEVTDFVWGVYGWLLDRFIG